MELLNKTRPRLPVHNLTYDDYSNALKALYPIMDALAETPRSYPNSGIEMGRWQIWQMALLLRRMTSPYQTVENPFPWVFHEGKFSGLNIGSRRCQRITKKRTFCKRMIRHGRMACYNHMTPYEKLVVRQYQDAIHIPFPRVGGKDYKEQLENQINKELDQLLKQGA